MRDRTGADVPLPLFPTAALERRARRLLALPPRRRRRLLARRHGLAGEALAGYLVEQAHGLRRDDPEEGLRTARAALQVIGALPGRRRSLTRRTDLRARAWAQVANLQRLREDYPAAEAAWQRADAALERGTGDQFLAAWLADLKASLFLAQRSFEKAQALLQRARTLYEGVDEKHWAGKALLKEATIHHHRSDVAAALEEHDRAGELLDLPRDRPLALDYFHNLAGYLADNRLIEQAAWFLRRFSYLYREVGSDVMQIRGAYLLGRLAVETGGWETAARLLEAARRGFLERRLPYLASLTALDLALAFLHLRRHRQVFHLAQEMIPVFTAREIPREASAAFLLFADAAQEHAATATLIHDVFQRLQAAGQPLPPGARRTSG